MRNFPNLFAVRNLVKRCKESRYSGKFALSSKIGLLRGVDLYRDALDFLKETQRQCWHCQLVFNGKPDDVTRVVPSIFYSFNRSRILRRLKISGIRACNVIMERGNAKYVGDITFIDRLGVQCFAQALETYFEPKHTLRVRLKYPKGTRSVSRAFQRQLAIEAIYRYMGCPKSKLYIVENVNENDEYFNTYELIIEYKEQRLYNLIAAILALPQLDELSLGNFFRCSSSRLFDEDNYYFMEAQEQLLPRYKHFSAFGELHNNPRFTIK